MTDRRVVPFKAHHYPWLLESNALTEPALPSSEGSLLLLERENTWTGVVDGDPIICAGTIRQWPGRYVAWACIATGTLRHMPWITEEVLKNLATVSGRIEMTVRADFPAGQRWAKRLGFEIETPLMRAYGPRGEDHVGFVRVNR
jgi:hypothetical protein